MQPYTATARIAATPERVWPVLSDVRIWPQWLPTMTSIARVGAGSLEVGARYRIEQPRCRPTVWTVVSIDPPNSFAWEARWPGARARASHSLIAASDGSSTIELQVVFSGPMSFLARAFAGGTIKEYLAREAASLKQRVEATL
jgi:uncharacterized protein YndB with AHSA1/START domain